LAARKARESAKREKGAPTLPSTISDELATNPFLRCDEPAIIAAAARHAGRALKDRVEVFAAIREWKNSF
ncbi:MAG TPA: hydroxyacylglutathione hydrolase C-terminal domain-containing protein, partial [Usitatibacter sp.]